MGQRVLIGLVIAAALAASCTTTPPPQPTELEVTETPSDESTMTAEPRPTVSAPAGLAIDTMATVAIAGVSVWERPSRTFRADRRLGHAMTTGTVVYLVAGPSTMDETDWWQVQPESASSQPVDVEPRSLHFGWVPGTDVNGASTLDAITPDCPSDVDFVPTMLLDMGSMEALACFGGRPLTFEGRVTCSAGVADGVVGGPSWMDQYVWCSMDGIGLPGAADLVGPDPTAVDRRYRVTAHFDDSQAQECHPVSFGSSIEDVSGTPEPAAVIQCRSILVVMEMTPLD